MEDLCVLSRALELAIKAVPDKPRTDIATRDLAEAYRCSLGRAGSFPLVESQNASGRSSVNSPLGVEASGTCSSPPAYGAIFREGPSHLSYFSLRLALLPSSLGEVRAPAIASAAQAGEKTDKNKSACSASAQTSCCTKSTSLTSATTKSACCANAKQAKYLAPATARGTLVAQK